MRFDGGTVLAAGCTPRSPVHRRRRRRRRARRLWERARAQERGATGSNRRPRPSLSTARSSVRSFVRSSASYATMVSTPFVGSNERTLPSRLSGNSNVESHASSSRRCTRRDKPNNLSHSLIHTRTRARPRRYFVSSSTRTASSSGSPRARPSTPSSPRCVSPPPPIDPPPGTTR